VPWVLEGHPDVVCARLDAAPQCEWPGTLSLDLSEAGGTFSFAVWVDAKGDLALPGDTTWFPRDVRVDGAAGLLRHVGSGPVVVVTPGSHVVEGRFAWPRLPESLAIPASVALLDLRVRGESVPFPRREQGGLLWLSQAASQAAEEDRLTLEVQRRVDDGVPVRLTTHLSLRVSGKAREADLGSILPPGFVPIQLSSGLPSRVDDAGHLRVQLRPGGWDLEITARSEAPVQALTAPTLPEPWPAQEFWVFAEASQVRTVRLTGPPGIDPQRTSIPEAWRGLPAFQLAPGATLAIEELRRGEAAPPPDRVDVVREMWLRQDGSGFTSRDQLDGELHQGGRLDVLAPAVLGRAAMDGQDQLITGPGGVEVRSSALHLVGDVTLARGGEIPAVGWNRDAQSLRATLHLPPGWRLLDVPGADRADGSWIAGWTLFDLFIVLLIGLGSWRVLGPAPAVGALALLTLSWHEEMAPRFTWLLILLPLALEPRVAEGRLLTAVRAVRILLALVLFIQVLVFARDQVRTGLFPHLAHGGTAATSGFYANGTGTWNFGTIGGAMAPPPAPSAPAEAWPQAEPPAPEAPVAARQAVDEMAVLGLSRGVDKNSAGLDGATSYAEQKVVNLPRPRASQVDTKAVVQTGPGLPRWSWSRHDLSWNGPVAADHTMAVLLLPPWAELILSLLRALGLAVLAWRFARFSDLPLAGRPVPPPAAAAALVFLLAAVAPGPASAADLPDAELLSQLEARLTKVPACDPACAEVSTMDVAADDSGLHITMRVHAAVDSGVRLPGPDAAWIPARALLDGRPVSALRRLDDGYLAVRVPQGTHDLDLMGPARDQVVLQFVPPPRVLTGRGDGWTLDGLRPDAPSPASLQLSRSRALDATGQPAVDAGDLPPWLELAREFDLGIPWLVHNELRRLGPPGPAVLVRVPLLPGESPMTAAVAVEGREAIVTLERGEALRAWDSILAEVDSVSLQAPSDRPWTEIWTLDCSPIFHCDTEGLAPTEHLAEGRARRSWRPWPGEQLTIRATRPQALAGETTTVDSALLAVTPGRRMEEAKLQLQLRSSQGGDQALTLPDGAQVQSFLVDGNARPFEVQDGRLRWSIEPGAHNVEVAWRRTMEDGVRYVLPKVDLGRDAANVEIQVSVPEHRWLLYAGGPRWGPVVTLWQYIFVVIALAILLGRKAPTPLSTVDWALLGLGMTQVPWVAAALVVGWLICLGMRANAEDLPWWAHDLAQLVLLAWTPLALGMLAWGVWQGLVVAPDMGVEGAGSWGTELHWFQDRSGSTLPQPWLLWLPRLAWRGVMLAWALWLALRFSFRWFAWIWRSWTAGAIWKSPPPTSISPPNP
jgi:hypothetical protein